MDNNLYCINCGGTFREHNTRMSNGECYYCYTMPKETIKQGKLKIDEPFPENDTDKAS